MRPRQEFNMKIIALALAIVPAVGCASTSTNRGPSVPDGSSSGVELVIVDGDATAPTFPARLTPASAPSANRQLAHRVNVELGGVAHADLRLCVGGDGSVTSASVVSTSGIEALDSAFVDEARGWRYAPLAADDATACQKVEISYVVRK
jgi:TonB family protein